MEEKKNKVIRRQKKHSASNPSKNKPSKESWEKLKEIALQKGWTKKP